MPFDKNPSTINRNGRPQGKSNKSTDELRQSVKQLIDDNLSRLQSDLDELDPLPRLQVLTGLLKFVLPQLKQIEVEQTQGYRTQPVVINLSADAN